MKVMNMNQSFFSVLIAGMLFSSVAIADGVSSLKNFYRDTNAMRASFHQEVKDAQGNIVQSVEGSMQLERPNKFRWDYNQPYEQQIISDGQDVFLLDIELEQVTIRSLDQALGMSPAALLAGGQGVEENFTLENVERDDASIEWVKATPKAEDGGFDHIFLGFKNDTLAVMEMVDSFKHLTYIVFDNVEQNPTLALETFLFQMPEGVDVVEE